MQSRLALLTFLALFGCGSTTPSGTDDAGGDDAAAFDAATDSQTLVFPDASADGDAGACNPPDMLVVLDRSDSMKQPPDGADGGASKWTLAVSSLDQITAAPTDGALRFGLELLPDQQAQKTDAGSCAAGLVSLDPGLGNGAAIATALSQTQLLSGTPIGGALGVAQSTLAAAKVDGRAQYVLLVTDGKETCDGAPPLPVVQALAAAGVSTFVVGFGGAVDAGMLNDLACAGLTAQNFSASCKSGKKGYVAQVPSSTHVYYDATSGADLETALASIATTTCCGCHVN